MVQIRVQDLDKIRVVLLLLEHDVGVVSDLHFLIGPHQSFNGFPLSRDLSLRMDITSSLLGQANHGATFESDLC